MNTQYIVNGMTCGSCVAKVTESLEQLPDVISATVNRVTNTADINMKRAIPIDVLEQKLKGTDTKYSILANSREIVSQNNQSWISTYKPIIIVFAYISMITVLIEFVNGSFDVKRWMRHFMASFFLVFSFFKILDLRGFADSYSTYDIIAKIWQPWAYLYAFIELGIGVSYLMAWNPIVTNVVAFIVMTVSIIGVLRSVLNKQKIQCACLGSVFDLPMSTVTIIEDALMIMMSGYMIFNILN